MRTSQIIAPGAALPAVKTTNPRYVNGALVLTKPLPERGLLPLRRLVEETLPAVGFIRTHALWLRLKCERPSIGRCELLNLLEELQAEGLVEFDKLLGWRKANPDGGDPTRVGVNR